MAVYLDTARNKFGRMIMCHMIADTEEELHEMPSKIGMKQSWFQSGRNNHYDVSLSRRKMAIEEGAIVLERGDFMKKLKEVRENVQETIS